MKFKHTFSKPDFSNHGCDVKSGLPLKSGSMINLFFWLLAISLMIGLTVPVLIRQGMFLDGIVYSAVSRNLSQGIGSFWFPYFDHFNMVNLPSFHEHPPLVFGIESLFFRAFGESMYVERFYVFLTMCLSAMLINIFWKEVHKQNAAIQKMGWLPIILWISIPVCFWSFSNNMCENTMSLFISISVLLMYKALRSDTINYGQWILAGVCLMLAFLCKGFPAFFPLGVPLLYWFTTRRISFSKAAWYMSLLLLTLAVFSLGLYLYPPSHQSLSVYLIKRAFFRINEQPNVDHRSFMLIRLFSELLPILLLTSIFILIERLSKISSRVSIQNKEPLFFISIGLSGSLPFLLTSIQSGYYLVPTLPFFGLGFACLLSSIVSSLIEKINLTIHKPLVIIGTFILVGVCIFSFIQKDKFSRDERLLHDVDLIGKTVPKYTRINCAFTTFQHYSFNSYLIRNFNISLNCVDFDKQSSRFFIVEQSNIPDSSLHLHKMNLPMLDYSLYQTIEQPIE